MDVTLVGSGPAAEAVRAALDDVDAAVTAGDAAAVGAADLAVVCGTVGDDAFDAANEAALSGGTPWLAVTRGGLGDLPLPDVEAAVAGFAPGAGCHDCLRSRVRSNAVEVPEEAAGDPGATRLAGAHAGRLAATAVRSDGPDRVGGRIVEVPHASREFLPVPGCVCGEGRDRTLSRTHEAVDLETALSRAERGLDERVGVVSQVGESESFPAPYYLAQTADTRAFSDARCAEQAAGVDADWNGAFMKALGEAIERYAAGVYRESEFLRAPPSALDAAVSPADLVRPDDAPSVDPDEPLDWVPGADLATGDPARLPAEAVHFPPPSERHLSAITTGLGLGTSPVGAMLSGLYEVVERDATMLAWYSTYDPLGLAVEDDGFEDLARRARAEGLSVTPLLVTQDVDVPVVSVAVHREGEWPRFAAGSDADLDPVAAARSALAEAVQNWMELRSMGPEGAAEDASAIGRYAEFPSAARSFVDPATTVPADSVGPSDPPSGTDELDALCARCLDADLTPYAARLTTRDLERVGLAAVRVVVPGAQPLFTGQPAFGDRARDVPADLGFEARLDRDHHPYP